MTRKRQLIQFPDFDFNRFMEYLERGVWPFLAQLVVGFVMLPVMLLVMVPFGPDWRYGAAGERMIWYPSVRLLRQRRVGDWNEVLQEVSSSISS